MCSMYPTINYNDLYLNTIRDRGAVAGRMSGEPLAEDARPFVAAMAADEQRVVLRCAPYATFAQPPRHLHRNDQGESVTHWVSASLPWDASDPTALPA